MSTPRIIKNAQMKRFEHVHNDCQEARLPSSAMCHKRLIANEKAAPGSKLCRTSEALMMPISNEKRTRCVNVAKITTIAGGSTTIHVFCMIYSFKVFRLNMP